MEEDQYTTIFGVSRSELNVKKSRFISLATSISTEQDAAEFINNIKSEFPVAAHYCYAFVIGTGPKKLVRSSDAGEPVNSAGKPILQAVEFSGLQNVICVVVRYFGGIKLGIGGLIRAYSQVARDCLHSAETIIHISYVTLQIEIPYAYIGAFVNLINRIKGKILNLTHSDKVLAFVKIRRSMVSLLEEGIRSINKDILVISIQSEGLT